MPMGSSSHFRNFRLRTSFFSLRLKRASRFFAVLFCTPFAQACPGFLLNVSAARCAFAASAFRCANVAARLASIIARSPVFSISLPRLMTFRVNACPRPYSLLFSFCLAFRARICRDRRNPRFRDFTIPAFAALMPRWHASFTSSGHWLRRMIWYNSAWICAGLPPTAWILYFSRTSLTSLNSASGERLPPMIERAMPSRRKSAPCHAVTSAMSRARAIPFWNSLSPAAAFVEKSTAAFPMPCSILEILNRKSRFASMTF